LGRPLREYIIDINKDTLMPRGWRVPIMCEGKALFLADVSASDAAFRTPSWGESIHHYEREDLMGILMARPLFGEFFYIRRENKDVFIQVLNPVTHQYFKNEYSLSEIINRRNRLLDVWNAPIADRRKIEAEIYGTNPPVDEKDIYDTHFPQKHELIMTPAITKMLTTEVYWRFIDKSDENLANFGITNKAQLENLQLGKPIPNYRIDIENEILIFTGIWSVPVMSDGEPLLMENVSKSIREDADEQYCNSGGGGYWLENYKHKDSIIGYLDYSGRNAYLMIRKDNKDIFIEVYDYATREYFKNEYSFREFINLLKK